jgi:hypothetical protein
MLRPWRTLTRLGPSSFRHTPLALIPFRSFSACTRPASTRSFILARSTGLQSAPRQHTLLSTRYLSLGSIFGRSKVAPTPSPATIAGISRLEAEANAHPHDIDKQLSLFKELSVTKLRAGYDLIVSRWERMCEFVRLLACGRGRMLTQRRTQRLLCFGQTMHSGSIFRPWSRQTARHPCPRLFDDEKRF